METLVLERPQGIYLTNAAHIVRAQTDVAAEFSSALADWSIEESSPFLTWITGDFVEADNPNSNTQFWTKDDLELAEYTIRYAPLNMVHRVRQPVGFFAATRTVELDREQASEDAGSMKIQALSGMWSHVFPFETELVEQANDKNLLFYSMECRGSHLRCAGDNGCGKEFEYAAVDTHCEHLKDRSSIRHIVNPVFRGGALIVPPVKPGWANATAGIHQEAVQQEAAKFAEQNEAQYEQALREGADISPSQWEQLMASIVALAAS